MRTNTFVSDKLTSEIVRRQSIFASFMESFNTGIALPPVMAQIHNRLTTIEQQIKPNENQEKSIETTPVNETVEDLIETVDERAVTCKDFELKAESTVKELTVTVSALEKIVDEKLKKIELLNASTIQLNKTMEETIMRVHALEKREPTPVITEQTGDFATKQDLKDTEKRIIKDLTDKIDAELIDAEERFDEKLKTSLDTIKLALDETIGGDEEEDGEEDNEEEDIDGVIDMD